jgi:hypothetical protein
MIGVVIGRGINPFCYLINKNQPRHRDLTKKTPEGLQSLKRGIFFFTHNPTL